jgi:hypothetical protein
VSPGQYTSFGGRATEDTQLDKLAEQLKADEQAANAEAARMLKLIAACTAELVLPPIGWIFYRCPYCSTKNRLKIDRIFYFRQNLHVIHHTCPRCTYEWAEKEIS